MYFKFIIHRFYCNINIYHMVILSFDVAVVVVVVYVNSVGYAVVQATNNNFVRRKRAWRWNCKRVVTRRQRLNIKSHIRCNGTDVQCLNVWRPPLLCYSRTWQKNWARAMCGGGGADAGAQYLFYCCRVWFAIFALTDLSKCCYASAFSCVPVPRARMKWEKKLKVFKCDLSSSTELNTDLSA